MTRRSSFLILSLAALLLPLALSCATRSPAKRGAVYPKVVLVPFTVEPQPVNGESDQNNAGRVHLLAEEASASATRALLGHLAETVERTASPDSAQGQVLVTGTVRLPVSLPPRVRGLAADSRNGTLAVATVRLQGADGTMIRETEARLTWREARWLEGAPRFKRNRRVDAVLADAVKEVVERAVSRLESPRG